MHSLPLEPIIKGMFRHYNNRDQQNRLGINNLCTGILHQL